MAKILSVVGGRPQFIKEAITGLSLRKNHEEILVHTGQHYDVELSRKLFNQLNIIEPKYNLGVGSSSHAKQTADVMIGIEEVLIIEKPDITLVYGDMNSTMGACIASAKLNIPVAHIEAGCRTYVFDTPEEQNRIVSDHLAKWNFASTHIDYEHLLEENLKEYSYEIGDVMYDAFCHFSKIAMGKDPDLYWNEMQFIYNKSEKIPDAWYFATIHRPENTDDIMKLKEILLALNTLPKRVIFPVHPRIKSFIENLYAENSYENIIFVKAVGYLESLFFTHGSEAVVTDSGGLQREAYWARKPVTIVLRGTDNDTMLKGNCMVMARPKKEDILNKVIEIERDLTAFDLSLYGDGHSCDKVSDILNE